MGRRLFLHIGQGKTGTSTIQAFMRANRAALAEHGYLYPQLTGAPRHLELSLYAKGENMVRSPDWWRMPRGGVDVVRRMVERDLPEQVTTSGCGNVVLSDEGLYRLRPAPFGRLLEALEPVGQPVFVIYLRRQDEHIVSRYKQTMREGGTLLLSEFVARPQTVATWQYDALLRSLVARHPDVPLVVRPYHRSRFPDGLVADFLDTVGAPRIGREGDGTSENLSLDAHTTEYLRRHNLTRGRADKALRIALARISDGPDLRMTEDEHREVWERLAGSNARLVREFMPDAGDVFCSPPEPRPGITQAEVTDADVAAVGARLAQTPIAVW